MEVDQPNDILAQNKSPPPQRILVVKTSTARDEQGDTRISDLAGDFITLSICPIYYHQFHFWKMLAGLARWGVLNFLSVFDTTLVKVDYFYLNLVLLQSMSLAYDIYFSAGLRPLS